jgi:arylsulfatase A-like enzyme
MTPDERRPNILMIVLDQARWDVLGCYGSDRCKTPVLDRLASEGVRFETCIAPTAICSPSRASLLTGRYPHGHGILNNTHEADAVRTELPSDLPNFPAMLRDAGYHLGFVGKWHVGSRGPESYGFHDVASVPEDVVMTLADADRTVESPWVLDPVFASYPRSRLLIAGIDTRPVEQTETRRYADAAIRLLRSYADIDQPFCLRVDFEGPHHPYLPPESFASRYDPASIPLWPSFSEDQTTKPAAQRRLLEQRGVAGWTWPEWQPVVARYFGFVTFIDAELGHLLETLDELELRDDTVVIVTADHGDMTGAHGGQFNKGPLMYDEVYRIPLIVRHPRLGRTGVWRSPVGSLALMPTILDLAGIQPPPGGHVASLLPALERPEEAPDDEAAFAEYHGEEWGFYSQRMIRTNSLKYVYSPHGTDELYDLRADPHEVVNGADDPALAGARTELQARLLRWMVQTDDPLALWASRILG